MWLSLIFDCLSRRYSHVLRFQGFVDKNKKNKKKALFPVIGHVLEAYLLQRLRRWRPLHNRQLQTPCSRSSTEQMKRSLFGVARCYNLLPQDLVDTNSVKLFQRRLQWGLRKCADSGLEDWKLLFSDVWRRGPRQNFDVHFC